MRSGWLRRLTPILLLLVVAGTYYGATDNGRLPEDAMVVWDNAAVSGSDTAGTFLGRFYSVTGEWRNAIRPTATFVQRLESGAFQQDRRGYQWALLLFHALGAALLSRLIARTSRSDLAGLLGAMIFAAHPALSASILRLAGLSEVLALALLLVALLLALPLITPPTDPGTRRTTRLGLIWILILGAVWAKEVAFVGIPILITWSLASTSHRWARTERGLPESAVLIVGLLAVTGIALLHRWVATASLPEGAQQAIAIGPDSGEPLLRRWLLGLAAVPTYLRLLAFPLQLGYAYDFAHAWNGSSLVLRAAVGAAVLSATAVLLVRSIRRRDSEITLWSSFVFFGLFAALGIVAPVGDYVSERAMYFLLPGVVGLTLCFFRRVLSLRSTWVDPIGTVVCVVMVGLFCVRAVRREEDFKDSETLIRAQQRTYPASAQAEYDLGNLFLSRGNFPAAQGQYEKAVALRDDFWMAWVNRGAAYSGMEEYGLARRSYEYAINGMEGEKDFATAQARAYFNRALVLMQQNSNREAAEDLKKTLEVFPNHLRAHANLGFIYRNSPDYDDDALYHIGRALELETNPENRPVLEAAVAFIKDRRAQIEADRQRKIDAGLLPDPADSLRN